MSELEILAGKYIFRPNEKARGGGFSSVRKATNALTGETVAVKFVSGAEDKVVRKLFEREESLLRRSKHPNIVRFVDSGIDDTDTPYLVLEWVERNVRELIDAAEPMPWDPFIVKVLRPLADALAYLHGLEIEHRDIKPINVLANDIGNPLLADFGIAKLRRDNDDTSLTLSSMHTHLWAPPEFRSTLPFVRDVFALGVMLIDGMTPADQRPTEFHELAGALAALSLPDQIRSLISESIDVSPEKRPKNAIEFLRRLDRAVLAQRPIPPKSRVQFYLTRTAREQIVGEGGFPDRAEAILLNDLSGEVWAAFRKDNESGEYDRTVIFLTGDTLSATLRLDDGTGPLRVSAVRRPDYETLEWARNRSRRVDDEFTWFLTRPTEARDFQTAIDMFLDRLTEHHEADDGDLPAVSTASSELLAAWGRSLDAREAIASERVGVLEFAEATRRGGRETEFLLLTEPEADLLDSEWQVLGPNGRRPTMRGHVVQQSGSSLFLRWQWGDGEVGASRQLHPYLGPTQSALNRQRDALRQIEVGAAANAGLLDLIASPEDAKAPRLPDAIVWNADLDTSKQGAVRAAIGSEDCVVVAGPPGTGKTRFIAETVAQYLQRKPTARVLIVSQTHVAIDNALDRLVKTGVTNIVRVGRPDDQRIAVSSHPLILDNQLEEWSRTARRRAETYFDARANEAGISQDHLRAVIHLEEFIALRKNRRVLQRRIPRSEDAQGQTASRLELADDPADLQKKVEDSRKRERELLQLAVGLIGDDLPLSERSMSEDAAAAVALLLSQSSQADELLDLLKLQADWLRRIASDDRLAAIFLASSRVVAGTCIGFIGHKAVRDLAFDLCIIDEASKATTTEALVPLVRSSRFVLVGDENQLPPLDEDLLHDRKVLQAHDLTKDFVGETLFNRLARRLPSSNRFLLTDQYRMIAPIGNLISSCFYEGALRSPIKQGIAGYENVGKAVLWLDTSRVPQRREDSDLRSIGSFLNRVEADIAIKRIDSIDSAIEMGLIARPSDGKKYDLLLIAPYRSQLDELARRLRSITPRHLHVEIESVDAVQGREADFAIFSVTRSNTDGRLGFLGEDYWRRINVALSRARFGLTIVGDAEFCASRPGGLKRVLTHIRAHEMECEMRDADVPN